MTADIERGEDLAHNHFPGVRRPDRHRWVDSHGLRIHVCEWGRADSPVLFLLHGAMDFAGTYDVFAPMLADAGWRVVSWDHRGHGDSDYAELYSWDADLRDAVAVMDSTTTAPAPIVGHSKGGLLTIQIAMIFPERVTRLASIDGVPTPNFPPDPRASRRRMDDQTIGAWLDHRHRAASSPRRAAPSIDDLASRRQEMNQRLSLEWLRYLVPIGARRDPDGWRWKLDPFIATGGFAPSRIDRWAERMRDLERPLLGLKAGVQEERGWGGHVHPRYIEPYMPRGGRLVYFEDAGHFIHVEYPREVADLVLEFLA